MCQTPYEHDHIKSFTEENSEAGWFNSFPKVTGRLPARPRALPTSSYPLDSTPRARQVPGSNSPACAPGQWQPEREQLGDAVAGRGWGDGHSCSAGELGRRPPLLEASPATLLVSYKLPPHSRPRPRQEGQLHCSLLCVCFMEPGRRGNPSPTSLRAQK